MTRLVHLEDRSSDDSVAALEFLLAKARNGEVVGLAYIAQLWWIRRGSPTRTPFSFLE